MSNKNYRNSVYCVGGSNFTAPVFFELNLNNDPVAGQRYALWYGHDGKYLGFTSESIAKKYVTGQLYYKTKLKATNKSPFKVRSANRASRFRENATKKYEIIYAGNEAGKSAGTCMFINIMTVNEMDLIDKSNISDTTAIAIKAIESMSSETNPWNFNHYPDTFGYIKKSNLLSKFTKEFEEMARRHRKEVIAYLAAQRDMQNGLKTLAMFRTAGQKNNVALSA